jgi:DNA-binding SARP family transcriptional activator
VQFRILGPIEAVLDSGPAALGAPKQRGLLALLLVNRRRVVTAEQLIELLLQPIEQERFDEAKAREELGDAYAPAHDAVMAQPLEEALREGGVLAEAPASP